MTRGKTPGRPRPGRAAFGPRRARAGLAAVEFAICLPLLITILLGVWDYGRLVTAKQIVVNAAREGCRQASSGQKTTTQVKQAALNYLKLSGLSTTGVTVTATNLASGAPSNDPSQASQLDQLQVVVTMPSSNARLIILNSLLGPSSLSATCTWLSMKDIPLSVSSTIPTN
ncbi:MAG: TadE/TadG family type IV pilus assembly protein [Isosphaeraceae bacterium]